MTQMDAEGRGTEVGGLAGEEATLVEGVGLIDRSGDGVVEVTGRDRATFLQGLVTNDVVALQAGQSCRAALLNVKARVLMLIDAVALRDRLRLIVPPGQGAPLLAKLDSFLIMEQVELADVTGRDALLSVQGPRAAELAEVMSGLAEVATTENGLLVSAPADRAAALWSALLGAGARRVSQQAAEVARIRAGIPAFGAEATEETFLPDLPLEGLVSWTKGCYLGQEPVARTHYRGRANRGLAGIALTGDVPAGTALWDGEREVGSITSTAFSHQLGRAIGLAVIRREALEPGTRLVAKAPAGDVAARVVPLPMSGGNEDLP